MLFRPRINFEILLNLFLFDKAVYKLLGMEHEELVYGFGSPSKDVKVPLLC